MVERVFPCRGDLHQYSQFMGWFPYNDSYNYGGAWNVRHFHTRILRDYPYHVHVDAKRATCGLQQTVSFLSVHSKVSVCLLTFLSGSHFYPPALGVCSVRFGWFCMCMANRNRIFRLVKFSTEIDRNGRKSIDFGGISVSVSFGFPKRGFGG